MSEESRSDLVTSKISTNGRIDFSRIPTIMDVPYLLDIQQKPFEDFLQLDVPPDERKEIGIQEAFLSVFPIESFNKSSSLEFVNYELGNWECFCGHTKGFEYRHRWSCECGQLSGLSSLPNVKQREVCKKCKTKVDYHRCPKCNSRVTLKTKYNIEECKDLGLTYAIPLKVTIRLISWDVDTDTEERSIRDIKEQQVYLGEMPVMIDIYTDVDGRLRCGNKGIFIINGTERAIVSQLHRSPGVFFSQEKMKTATGAKIIYSARIVPYRGSWLEFEFDSSDILHVRIDRKRKLPATVIIRALGMNTTEEILDIFYESDRIEIRGDRYYRKVNDKLKGETFNTNILDSTGGILIEAGKKISTYMLNNIRKKNVEEFEVPKSELLGKILAKDIFHPETDEIILTANTEITDTVFERITESNIQSFQIILDKSSVGESLRETLKKDKSKSKIEAQREIYRILRPGDPLTEESARSLFNRLFFDPRTFDLSRVGRMKMNRKLNLSPHVEDRVLRPEDIFETIRYLLRLKTGSIPAKEGIDDIDHLGNRRVRTVGELLENQLRIGLVRIEKAIKERMNIQDISTSMPYDLINAKPITATLKEFFGSSQLSQFLDQTNPLAEMTHKRRLSALGPGGLSRERAGFDVRDVNSTHYGRICPIETPEGPNVGLITSLSTYARVNQLGFIETPYRFVEDGKVTNKVAYLSALDEDSGGKEKPVIAQANAPVGKDRRFLIDRVSVRKGGEAIMTSIDEVTHMDVSPKQLVSVSTSLIPFLEHDDANRALMGSNMQRQAVPLMKPSAPLVGTGMEFRAAHDSGVCLIARRSGIIESATSERIIIRADEDEENDGALAVDIYDLVKFRRSNQNTCINQKPIVKRGDRVKRGEVIADGPATDHGELALGQNILTAFMPWGGYNYEDAILISERVVQEDKYTSIHIEEFNIEARETKLGKEEITRDIPNASEEKLRNLDESGVVRIGAMVKPGDILVGKITPKGESQLTPEEKLLRAIFGEKAGDVKDASLKTPPGIDGVVIDVKVFCRKDVSKDYRTQEIEDALVERYTRDRLDQIGIIHREAKKRMIELLNGLQAASDVQAEDGSVLIAKGKKITAKALENLSYENLLHIEFKGNLERKKQIQRLDKQVTERTKYIDSIFKERVSKIGGGDDLPPGVIKMVKVYVAMKRKLQVGDKMAGRHGNKGVLAKIVPVEDMPYLPDGTPVDLVLNPLGVPSRMNVGQILECHLGMAGAALGLKFASPVFDGAKEDDIKQLLVKAGLSPTGQSILYDGRTGQPFDMKVTVGYMYMMKLNHLVEDKIHARSTGPYSLVTQQPLGGKAQFGGQRFGEMEVWALEAYGAAYTLQEILTVKSDDVEGRTRIYQAIVKNTGRFEAGVPESFNVLIRELKSLALDVELINVKE